MLDSVNSFFVPFFNPPTSWRKSQVTTFEIARNGFAVVGLLAVSALIGLAVWHAVTAWRLRSFRRRVRSSDRAVQLARAAARSQTPSDELEEVFLGEAWVPPHITNSN